MKEFDDNYSDDPVESETSKDSVFSKLFSFVGIAALLVIGSTFAANINLNSGQNVEFGQGVSVATTCDNSITVTPYSSFTNASGGGNFYFSSFKLSGVDVNSCNGATFAIKVYDSSTAIPLTLFGTSNQVLITDSGTAFSLNSGQSGLSLSDTGTIGSATINISSPLALASSVSKITLESSGSINSSSANSNNAISASYSTVSSFALYPDIYASTLGGKIFASGDSKVYVSSDTGTTWSITSLPTADAMTVAGSQDGSKVWVAGANGRIYFSSDSGSSFALKYNYDGSSSFDYIATENSGTKMIASRCTAAPSTFLMTTNSGTTWQTVPTPVPNGCAYYGIALTGNGNQIFTARYNDYIYKTSDTGTTWTQLTGAGSRYWKGFAVSTDGNYIVASAHNDYAYFSINGGTTWSRASGPISSYWQTASIDSTGRVMAVASVNGDIYASTDYGSTWSEISLGISRQYWYSSSITSDGKFLLLGTYSYGLGSYIYKIAIPGA